MPDDRSPDETLALAVVVTGVLLLTGSAAIQVIWLIAIAVAGGIGRLRRSAARDAPPGDGGTPPAGAP